MEILRSDVLGFCFGVRKAVELTEQALNQYKDKKVYSLGPLIHNDFVLNRFGKKGLIIIENDDLNQNDSSDQNDSLNQIEDNSVVIIRAHGVSPAVIKKIEEKNCIIVNATCPKVRASQIYVEKRRNERIIFTGDSNHGEVKGIAGFSDYRFDLINSVEEAKKLDVNKNEKTVLLSQTTFSKNQFEQISTILKERIPGLEVLNTICSATKERQDALVELCSKVDGVVVIGGKKSANTKRLYELALENCNNVICIESAEEIPEDFYRTERVGITAGASTPDEIVDMVEKALKSGMGW